jgi:dipeptidyl aminopeptidase/acylaminoacyl peptidase
MSAILKHDPPELSTTSAAVAPSLASVIQHCLEKERDQRFQSARDLSFALKRLSGTSGSGTLATPVDRSTTRRRWMLGAAAVVALVSAIGATTYFRSRTPIVSAPAFQQLTFRRGQIGTARFMPDGQTVIASGFWEGQPLEVVSTRLDTGEATALPLKVDWFSSISRSGDLAVIVKKSILASVSGGSGPRELAENVFDADWAPDGSQAVVGHKPNRAWVEYPLGTRIYEPKVPGSAVYRIRISPNGELVALGEQEGFGGGREWLTIIDRKGAVVSQSVKRGSNPDSTFAWTPDGREVWFTASESSDRSAIHAIGLDGHERIVYRAMGSMRILDFAKDGRTLLSNEYFNRADMTLVDVTTGEERDLTWKDWSRPLALSDDGKMLAFGVGGRTRADGRTFGFIRPTDGSPAIRLSEDGNPSAFSPDGKWVKTGKAGATQITLVPTGAGESRRLEAGRVSGFQSFTRWLPDSTRIVFAGREAGRPTRLFTQSLAAGLPQPLTPEGAFGPLIVSPDSAAVIVKNEEGRLTRYPVTGSTPTPVVGALPEDEPLAWSQDGHSIWVLLRPKTPPAKIFRIDLRSGVRSLWREVPYSDPSSMQYEQLRVVMSADGSKFVYGYQKHLCELFVATGLK